MTSARSSLTLRPAATAIELLVIVAIVLTLLGLFLSAVQRIQEAAARVGSMNNVRQMCIAVHDYAAVHDERLPNATRNPSAFSWGVGNVFVAILPFIEQEDHQQLSLAASKSAVGRPLFVKTFRSPADFTLGKEHEYEAISYVANYQVFKGKPSFTHTFRDGCGNTIMFAEHYAHCWDVSLVYGSRMGTNVPFFAGGDWRWYPVTRGDPPVTLANMDFVFPGVTFQVAPPFEQCWVQIPQTPHHDGMIVGMCDGSVRTIRRGVEAHIFWGATTPSSGELVSAADF